jgi:hypothetical protein
LGPLPSHRPAGASPPSEDWPVGATSLNRFDPGLNRLESVAPVAAEGHGWDLTPAGLLVDPADRHTKELGNLRGSQQRVGAHYRTPAEDHAGSAFVVRLLSPVSRGPIQTPATNDGTSSLRRMRCTRSCTRPMP